MILSIKRCFFREVIAKKPEDFKIECLKNIASLYPGKNPFYAGFGNRINVRFVFLEIYNIYFINIICLLGSMGLYCCWNTGDTYIYN